MTKTEQNHHALASLLEEFLPKAAASLGLSYLGAHVPNKDAYTLTFFRDNVQVGTCEMDGYLIADLSTHLQQQRDTLEDTMNGKPEEMGYVLGKRNAESPAKMGKPDPKVVAVCLDWIAKRAVELRDKINQQAVQSEVPNV